MHYQDIKIPQAINTTDVFKLKNYTNLKNLSGKPNHQLLVKSPHALFNKMLFSFNTGGK